MRMRDAIGVLVGAAAVALGAQIDVPMVPVPMTLQSLAVVAAGGLLGARLGPVAMLLYLLVGGLGAPVFARGGSGTGALTGATAGYLIGFVPAAWIAGRPGPRSPARWIGLMIVAHVAIVALGGGWLAWKTSPALAWSRGAEPFIAGMLVKSAVAGLVVWASRRLRASRSVS